MKELNRWGSVHRPEATGSPAATAALCGNRMPGLFGASSRFVRRENRNTQGTNEMKGFDF